MLYPTNIKVNRISKIQKVKRKIFNLFKKIKKQIKYLIFDRKNLGEKIASKFHF